MNLILVLCDAAAWLACVVLLIAVIGSTRGRRTLRRRWYGWVVSLAIGGILVAAWVR